ncbi:MAG TPA: PilZ domain-containing protein [Terriglobales bacterium]|jgi:hypothetical protein
MKPFPTTRRWPRHEVDLPVRVAFQKGASQTVVQGRGMEISEGGMALCAGVDLKPQDLMEVEFEAPSHARVMGVVRNRAGYTFGLEFVSPLLLDNEMGVSKQDRRIEAPASFERRVFSPEAAEMFEKIKVVKGQDAAYALLAQVLHAAGWPRDAEKAAEMAATFFMQTKEAYLRQREGEIEQLRREIELLHRARPLLAEADQRGEIPAGLPELISALPHLLEPQ